MIKPKPNTNPFTLSPGHFFEQYWNDREEAVRGMINWEFNCIYQLKAKALSGYRQVLDLNSIQLNHVSRPGGMMHTPSAAANSFLVLVIEACADKACLGPIKLQSGNIIFLDCSHTHTFINNGAIEFTVVNIQKSSLGSLLPTLINAADHQIHDTDCRFTSTLHKILKCFSIDSAQKKDAQSLQQAEDEILAVIMKLLSEQTPTIPKLTAGEKIALKIREQVFGHMDGPISISSLARQYRVSEQTLQSSFKSLFGFTPKRFFRLLKLNLVHHDLVKSNPDKNSVMKIAHKWGFTHMGRFSCYYTELFGQNPSLTLKTSYFQEESIKESCIIRQEEIN